MKLGKLKKPNGEYEEFEYNEDDYFLCNDCGFITMIEYLFENKNKCLNCQSKNIQHFEG